MPLKLVPPRKGKTSYFSVRGTHFGFPLDRSTKTAVRADAKRLLRKWEAEIECGALALPGEKTFSDACVSYLAHTGNDRFLPQIVEHIGRRPLREITQALLDQAAIALYPNATAATRNRQLYTPVSAILKHAGVDAKIRRPKGWRGRKRIDWLQPGQAFRLFDAAKKIDPEFSLFLYFLCYTGTRLSEALSLTTDRVLLSENSAFVVATKNGDPRMVYLPDHLVHAMQNHPRGMQRGREKVFKFIKCGRLYAVMERVKAATGPDVSFLTFHSCRHTWASWMRRYAGLDVQGLVETGAWRDTESAARYAHSVPSEASRRAALLPVENAGTFSNIESKPLEKKHG